MIRLAGLKKEDSETITWVAVFTNHLSIGSYTFVDPISNDLAWFKTHHLSSSD
jgi:hypothetical protein